MGSWLSFNSRMILKAGLFLHLMSKLPSRQIPGLPSISFFVYCGHFLFCSVWVHPLGPKLVGMGTGCESVLMFAFIVPGLALTAAVYAAGKKFCPKVLRVFDGTFM